MGKLKPMRPREVIKKLEDDGWFELKERRKTSHRQYAHPTKPGKVTVPTHPGDIPVTVLASVARQAQMDLRD